jgi:AcrR family transcriptional regulator
MPRRSQEERSRSTRAALVATARGLFAERGYAQVPAEEIVTAAGVTRGALYHHFSDKRGLFRAVFEELEGEMTAEVAGAIAAAPDRSSGMVVGLARFLDVCQRPEVVRIALTDAPAVLGWGTWRAIESRHGLGLNHRRPRGGRPRRIARRSARAGARPARAQRRNRSGPADCACRRPQSRAGRGRTGTAGPAVRHRSPAE